MASKGARRDMRRQKKPFRANQLPPTDIPKFLERIDNAAKAARNSERRRKLVEGDTDG